MLFERREEMGMSLWKARHFRDFSPPFLRNPFMRRVLAVFTAAFSLLALGGCAEKWTFSHGGSVPSQSSGTSSPETATNPQAGGPGTDGGGKTAPAELPAAAPNGTNAPAPPREDVPRFQNSVAREGNDILSDYKNYYSWETLRDSAIVLAGAAPLANTDLDAEFATWYQTRIRSPESNRIAAFWKPFGDGVYTLPACIPLALAEDLNLFDDRPILHVAGDWGDRTTRAFLVGAPPMLAMQEILGGLRPDSLDAHSSWRPFSADNGVSGHAFMGSVPFITAAQMTDEPAAKGLLYACSFMTGWLRINDNAHYLSEVCLGWWMGYLACRSVNETNYRQRQVQVLPIVTPEMSGVGVQIQR